MQLPEWMRTMFLVASGDGWPEADEDQLWALAGEWTTVGDAIDALQHRVTEPVRVVRRTGWDGPAADAFAMAGTGLHNQQLSTAATGSQSIASFVHQTGINVQYMKIIVLQELTLIAGQIAHLLTMAGPSFGGSLAAIAGLKALGQYLARAGIARLNAAIASLAISEGIQLGIDTLGQTVQLALRTRRDWDPTLSVNAAIVGAVGGALGPVIHGLGTPLNMIKGKVGQGLSGIVTNASHEYLTSGVSGVVTGQGWTGTPWDVTAGATDSAASTLTRTRRGHGVLPADLTLDSTPRPATPSAVSATGRSVEGTSSDTAPLRERGQRMEVTPTPSTTVVVAPAQTQTVNVFEPASSDGPTAVGAPAEGHTNPPPHNNPPLHDHPPMAVTRTVDASGTVALGNRLGGRRRAREISVSTSLAGQQVTVRLDQGRVEVIANGTVVHSMNASRWRLTHAQFAQLPGVVHADPHPSAPFVAELPRMITRTVDTNGTISLGNRPDDGTGQRRQRRIHVHRDLIGRQVTVRLDQGRVEVIADDAVVHSLSADDLDLTYAQFAQLRTASTAGAGPSGQHHGRSIREVLTGRSPLAERQPHTLTPPRQPSPAPVGDTYDDHFDTIDWIDPALNESIVADPQAATTSTAGQTTPPTAATDHSPTTADTAAGRHNRERAEYQPTQPRTDLELPMVVTRKVDVNGNISMGNLPDDGTGRRRQRKVYAHIGLAGQQVTVRFDQDRVGLIVDGTAVMYWNIGRLSLTRAQFAQLSGVIHLGPRPPATSVSQPSTSTSEPTTSTPQPTFAVTRQVDTSAEVRLGNLPDDGTGRRRSRKIYVGMNMIGWQVTVELNQDRVEIIADGNVVKSRRAEDLQLTHEDFAQLVRADHAHRTRLSTRTGQTSSDVNPPPAPI